MKSAKLSFSIVSMFISMMITAAASSAAKASILTLEPSGHAINGISISKSGSTLLGGQTVALSTFGAGLRSKRIAFTNLKLYVAQILVDDIQQAVHTDPGALDSISKMKAVGIRLDFLRTVDANSVQSSLRESLDVNSVNLSDPTISAFLKAVAEGGDATAAGALNLILAHSVDGAEMIVYEDMQGKVTTLTGSPGSIHSILSIWLGVPSDSGVADLKRSLIGGSIQ